MGPFSIDVDSFMGFALDAEANLADRTHIHATGTKPVLHIAADEEAVICDLVLALLNEQRQSFCIPLA